jgi:hypothetical protein
VSCDRPAPAWCFVSHAGAARGVPSGRHHGAREARRGVRRDGRQRRRQGELRGVQGGHAEGQRPPGRRPLVPPAAAAAIARPGERFQLVQLHSHENAPLITVPFESFNQSPACAVVRSGRLVVGNSGRGRTSMDPARYGCAVMCFWILIDSMAVLLWVAATHVFLPKASWKLQKRKGLEGLKSSPYLILNKEKILTPPIHSDFCTSKLAFRIEK